MLFSLNTRTPQRKKRVAEIVKQIKETFGNNVLWVQELNLFTTIQTTNDILGYVDVYRKEMHLWNEPSRATAHEIKMNIPLKELEIIY